MSHKCSHEKPLLPSAELFNPDLCPPCLIDRHIKEIRECQVGITNRGGIFGSKQKLLDEREEHGAKKDQQTKRHRAWIRKWRTIKIQTWRDIEMLQGILENLSKKNEDGIDEVTAESVRNLTQSASTRWETDCEILMEVP
jgi:hypothetical protein